jgi:prolyl oligopeptidase
MTPLKYPDADRGDTVTILHGQTIPDPYRWLENNTDYRKPWLAAQARLSAETLELSAVSKASAFALARKAYDFEHRYDMIWKNGRYFFLRRTGLQQHPVLVTAKTPRGRGRVLIDPNEWSKDGTAALSRVSVSPDGNLIAYAVSFKGQDAQHWRLLNVNSGRDLPDVFWEQPAWSNDSRGFYLARNMTPTVKAAPGTTAIVIPRAYFWQHAWGNDPQESDYLGEIPPVGQIHPYLSVVGDWLLAHAYEFSTSGPAVVSVNDLRKTGAPGRQLFGGHSTIIDAVAAEHDRLLVRTTYGADKGRLVSIDLASDNLTVVDVIPEEKDYLHRVVSQGGRFVTQHVDGANNRLSIYDQSGKLEMVVPLPDHMFVQSLAAASPGKVLVCASSMIQPGSSYLLDVKSGEMKTLHEPISPLGKYGERYKITKAGVTSADGAIVPLILAHRKDIKLDGNNPTLLKGYGGFRSIQQGQYGLLGAAFLEAGGIYAFAGIRGGCEYGEDWHRQACGVNRQKSYDDFIACAEWLIRSGYSRPDRLAITGTSNGGLLVAAVLTQRPDLFGACIAEVGLMDMVRYADLNGSYWREDYGHVSQVDQFGSLLSCSPLHQVKPGTIYPAVMLSVGDNDNTVNVAHSYKFAAALQHAQAGTAPILLHVTSRSGHGHGMPTSKVDDLTAARMSFLSLALGFEL